MVAWATRSVSVPPETTRTLVSVAPTDQSSGANPLEQRVGGARPNRTAVALSPDGKTLVFGAIWGGDHNCTRARWTSSARHRWRARAVAAVPFSRPTGNGSAFGAGGELRKVPLGGGPAVTLCKAAAIFGASWGSDGTIVFATARNGGLWRVSAAGGTARGAHDPSAGRVQSSVAPHAARRPRRHLHDLEGRESVGRHADRRAVPCNGRSRPSSSREDRMGAMCPRDTWSTSVWELSWPFPSTLFDSPSPGTRQD